MRFTVVDYERTKATGHPCAVGATISGTAHDQYCRTYLSLKSHDIIGALAVMFCWVDAHTRARCSNSKWHTR